MNSLICTKNTTNKFNSSPTSADCKRYFVRHFQAHSGCFSEILPTYTAVSLLLAIT